MNKSKLKSEECKCYKTNHGTVHCGLHCPNGYDHKESMNKIDLKEELETMLVYCPKIHVMHHLTEQDQKNILSLLTEVVEEVIGKKQEYPHGNEELEPCPSCLSVSGNNSAIDKMRTRAQVFGIKIK